MAKERGMVSLMAQSLCSGKDHPIAPRERMRREGRRR